jgi:2-polyprenyl-6-methoxyphenol hydroxylase-like FAD-dependent oxidoreductase
MVSRSPKAIIIGGGIAGPVTAILLKRIGIESTVFEAWPQSTAIGGGLQIAPNGMRVLEEAGLADEMIRRGSICESIEFFSQPGVPLASVNRDMARRFGRPAVNMRRSTLNEAILAKAKREGINVVFNKRLVRIEDRADRPVAVQFEDGSSAEGDFVIGADGVHSTTRGHVIRDAPMPFDTGLVSFGGFVPRSLLEAAGSGPSLYMTFGQSGFFGYGYCGSDVNGGMCWSTQPVHGIDTATFRAMDQAALRRHLRLFHAGWYAPIPQLIEAMGEIVVTSTLDIATLPTWSRGRTLLIGDAAHATSPHAGQGASVALEDALRLALQLQQEQDLATAFQSFESERRPRVERVVALARRNGNQKREFGRAGAWVRDRLLKLLIPFNSNDWLFDYDAGRITPRPETSGLRDRQAA